MRDTITRILDLLGACVALVLAAPVVAVAAVAILAESGPPAFFRQQRAGKRAQPFTILKLRTMAADAPQADVALGEGDPSITRVGRILRAASIDELPQLWNVLRGDMSLVGPRPTIPAQAREYDEYQRRRLEIKPGITGWAQVNGRNTLSWAQKIDLDVWYVDHASVRLYLLVLLKTIPAALHFRSTWAKTDGPREVAE